MGENFAFAFNDLDFSDRILRLVITPDDDDGTGDGAKVTTLHISSAVLASKSQFFYKLFKNGMRESQNKNEVSLNINASDEATLMDLLRFMYGKTALNATSIPDLVDLLIAADKFEVTSCMSYCVEMLLKFPMSLEYALFYLEQLSSVLFSQMVKPLIDAAKQLVVTHHRDFSKSQQEAMQLPLSAIEALLGSEGLQVVSEDDVFSFVLKWARASYPKLEERRQILTNRLAQLICFPKMSVPKLKELLACTDFDYEHVSKLVLKALFSKVELSCGQLLHEDLSATECVSAGRVYSPHCVVFFNLTKDEGVGILPLNRHASPKFCLGGTQFNLLVIPVKEKDTFGLFLEKASGSETCTIDLEFSVMKKSSMEFESRLKVNNCTMGSIGWELQNLLGITWTELISEDSDYFINGVLRLRAELTIKNSKT